MDHHEHHATFDGLEHWTKHCFEHLGWMLLAERDGRDEKLYAYLCGIYHLKCAIEDKIAEVSERDRKEDLKILLKNVECLHATAHRMFPSSERLLENITATHEKWAKKERKEKGEHGHGNKTRRRRRRA
jgi:hypothetical protein